MRAHVEHLVAEYIARGLTPDAAREAARREFGPVTQLTEESRDARGVAWLANGWQDMPLRRAPDATDARLRRGRDSDHRARHRRHDGDVQRRLRRGAAAAAVSASPIGS